MRGSDCANMWAANSRSSVKLVTSAEFRVNPRTAKILTAEIAENVINSRERRANRRSEPLCSVCPHHRDTETQRKLKKGRRASGVIDFGVPCAPVSLW